MVELRRAGNLVDPRLAALVEVVNAERASGFPSGRLFLDSIAQALAVVLVNGYALRHRSLETHRGSLGSARLRRIKEFVHAKMEGEFTLYEMAQCVEFSTAHFSRMFRESTGESPHHFVLRHRVERAKEMLRADEARVLSVAVGCGFKTQQHFARVFRRMRGVSPTDNESRRHRTEIISALAPAPSSSNPDGQAEKQSERNRQSPPEYRSLSFRYPWVLA